MVHASSIQLKNGLEERKLGVTQLEQAGSAAGALWAVPAPLLRATDAVERSLSTGSGGQFSAIARYLCPQLRNS